MSGLGTTPKRRGRLPLHPNSIWKQVSQGKFPKPVRLSENVVAWRITDIEEWERQREAAPLDGTPLRRMKARKTGEVAA